MLNQLQGLPQLFQMKELGVQHSSGRFQVLLLQGTTDDVASVPLKTCLYHIYIYIFIVHVIHVIRCTII